MPSPIAVEVVLSEEEREQLESWARRRSSARALAQRSRIVLAATEGLKNTEVAERLWIDRACQGRLKMHPPAPVENAPPLWVRRLGVERGA